jgi:antitoxin HicB
MKFRVTVEPDEDGVFVAECPSLPGCVSQGNTREEAMANIRDAIQGYLDSLKKHGEPIPRGITEEIVEIPAWAAFRCVRARMPSRLSVALATAVDHQSGSHIILRHASGRRLTVPNHRHLAKGTLRALIREAGLTKEQFTELL